MKNVQKIKEVTKEEIISGNNKPACQEDTMQANDAMVHPDAFFPVN